MFQTQKTQDCLYKKRHIFMDYRRLFPLSLPFTGLTVIANCHPRVWKVSHWPSARLELLASMVWITLLVPHNGTDQARKLAFKHHAESYYIHATNDTKDQVCQGLLGIIFKLTQGVTGRWWMELFIRGWVTTIDSRVKACFHKVTQVLQHCSKIFKTHMRLKMAPQN